MRCMTHLVDILCQSSRKVEKELRSFENTKGRANFRRFRGVLQHWKKHLVCLDGGLWIFNESQGYLKGRVLTFESFPQILRSVIVAFGVLENTCLHGFIQT